MGLRGFLFVFTRLASSNRGSSNITVLIQWGIKSVEDGLNFTHKIKFFFKDVDNLLVFT